MESNQNNINLKKTNNICLESAFTLAEVLITLAIIGIVAAMTIPTMIQKIQIEQFRVALKKEYSAFTEAINMLQTLNGSIDTSSNNNFVNELATQLLIQRQGTYSSLTTLPTNFNYKCYKASSGICGDLIKRPTIDGNKVLMTNGGVLYIIHNSTNPNCTSSQSQVKMNPAEVLPQNNVCGTFFIDLNGDKNPNQIGVDMHLAYLLKNNNRYYVRFSGANVDSNCSAEHPNVSSYSLHCTNRMPLGEPMP